MSSSRSSLSDLGNTHNVPGTASLSLTLRFRDSDAHSRFNAPHPTPGQRAMEDACSSPSAPVVSNAIETDLPFVNPALAAVPSYAPLTPLLGFAQQLPELKSPDQQFNLDFSTLESGDVLENFDFDTFLNNVEPQVPELSKSGGEKHEERLYSRLPTSAPEQYRAPRTGPNHQAQQEGIALPDYKTQLLLLEELGKKKAVIARQEQDQQMRFMLLEQESKRQVKLGCQEQDSVVSHKIPVNTQPGNHALQDYQMQLMLLEQQNKKRVMLALQKQKDTVTAGLQDAENKGHALQDDQTQLMLLEHQKKTETNEFKPQNFAGAVKPGPIPAKNPIIIRQDGNGVKWVAFEYTRDGIKMEYTIRSDIESVKTDNLTWDFKAQNCVYSRTAASKGPHSLAAYETECNMVGWALAELNPCLRSKRELILRAVDSWRQAQVYRINMIAGREYANIALEERQKQVMACEQQNRIKMAAAQQQEIQSNRAQQELRQKVMYQQQIMRGYEEQQMRAQQQQQSFSAGSRLHQADRTTLHDALIRNEELRAFRKRVFDDNLDEITELDRKVRANESICLTGPCKSYSDQIPGQEYYMQLILLEQGTKMREVRAAKEQERLQLHPDSPVSVTSSLSSDGDSDGDSVMLDAEQQQEFDRRTSSFQVKLNNPNRPLHEASPDYVLQLAQLEAQNKERLMVAQQEKERFLTEQHNRQRWMIEQHARIIAISNPWAPVKRE